MVDQCFLELSPGEPDRLVRELEGGGLLLLRALTKSYAMAGLRLGYCLSDDRTLLAAMAEEGPPGRCHSWHNRQGYLLYSMRRTGHFASTSSWRRSAAISLRN